MRTLATPRRLARVSQDVSIHGDLAREPVSDQPLLETFRLLALQLDRMLPNLARQSILVLSARSGDGRSLLATSLAQSLASLRPPVVLLDADPVGGGLVPNGGVPSWPVDGTTVASENGHGLPALSRHRVDSGRRPQLQVIGEVHSVLEQAEEIGAITILDTPPCLVSSLAFSLVPSVGGVLYLARRRLEEAAVHEEIRGQLDLLGARLLGVVFNEG